MKWIRLTAVFLLLLGFAACTAAETGGGYYTFTDDTGAEVSLNRKPERAAVLFSSFTEIWNLAGGITEITVGEAVERGLAENTAVLVDEGAGKAVNLELLIASEPDFVILSADIAAQTDAAAVLRDAGIPCALFRVESFDDYLRMLRICCDITGNEEAYETCGTAVKREVEKILSDMPDRAEKRILFLRAGSSARSTKAKTAEDHFAAAMLAELGAYNIADNAPVLLDGLSMEEIMTENPDAVFITTMGDEEAAAAYMKSQMESPEWQTLDAVKNGRVYFLPKELFQFKPNHRWAQAYQMLTELLYEN